MFDAFYNILTESLLLLYQFLGHNYILAITVFTVIIRLITLPLNLRQQRSMLQTQEMQPQIQAIQKKYRDNPQKMQEEFAKIGYNPADALMGCLPTLIQFPILIGMYRAIQYTLGSTPLDLYELSLRAKVVDLSHLLPISNKFLWLNLAQPDPLYILPILVGGGMYLQQKLFMPANSNAQNDKDNPTAAMSRSMLYTMPLMFGMFSLSFPSGLSIYFVVSNLIGILQGYITRRNMDRLKAEAALRPKPAVVVDEVLPTAIKEIEASKNQSSKNGQTATRKQKAKKGKAGKR